MAISQQRLTLEAFLKLPDEKPALEYWDGMVIQKASPQAQHGRLQLKLGELFNRAGEPSRLAMAFSETRFTVENRSTVPDVIVYRWDRVPRDRHGKLLNRFVEPPDIAAEIASPDPSIPELVEKCRGYIATGVRIVLLIELDGEWLRRFGPSGESEPLRGADRVDLDSVLPGFELTAQELFDSLYDR